MRWFYVDDDALWFIGHDARLSSGPYRKLLDGGFRLALGAKFGANEKPSLLGDPRAF